MAVIFLAGAYALLVLDTSGQDLFFGPSSLLRCPHLLGAIIVLFAGALLWGRTAGLGFQYHPPSRVRAWEVTCVLALVLLAGGLRLWRLADYPAFLDYDTAQNGFIALALIKQLPTHGFQAVLLDWATGNEAAYLYVVGMVLHLLGVSVEALRLSSAVVGTLTILVIYLLGRQLFSAQVGLVAGFLAALAPWHIRMSRWATRPILTALFVALVLLLLCRALQYQRRSRAGMLYMVLCGLALGAGLHGYEAFRVFPLAVAASIIWVRWRQGRLGLGLLELAVVTACSLLVTLPILITVIGDPDVYMAHVSTQSIFVAVSESGSWLPLLKHPITTLGYFLFGLPFFPTEDPRLSAPLVLGPGLFLLGLVGLIRAEKGEMLKTARAPLLLTLVLMTLPFMLTRFSIFSPRRYGGELVPFFLLAGGAAVGLVRAMAGRWGRIPAGIIATVAAAGLLTTTPNTFTALQRIGNEHRNPREERLLRWCIDQARDRDVYLAPQLLGHSYLARFFLEHPRIHKLPTVWPLPHGPLQRSILLVSSGEPWWAGLSKTFGAVREEHTLSMPPGHQSLTVSTYLLERQRVLERRLTARHLRASMEAHLMIHRPGLYSFRYGDSSSAFLNIRDHRHQGGGPFQVTLAAGLHPLHYNPGTGRAARGSLQWRPPGEKSWLPLDPRLLWTLPEDIFPLAPPTRTLEARVEVSSEAVVPGHPSYEHCRKLQDLEVAPDGYYILDLDRTLVKHWRPATPFSHKPLLFSAPGEPFTVPDSYESDQQKTFSLAHSSAGFFLLDAQQARILHFNRKGLKIGPLDGPFKNPVDLAVMDDRLFVADPGREALLICDLKGKEQESLPGVLPVAVAVQDQRLAYLDKRKHRLMIHHLDADTSVQQVQLARVDDQMRLSMARDYSLLLSDPAEGQLLMYTAQGVLLAPEGDPLALSGELKEKIDGDVALAAHYDSRRKRFIILGSGFHLVTMILQAPETP